MSDLKSSASAKSVIAQIERDWRAKSDVVRNLAAGRAPVALGWSLPATAKTEARPAKTLRTGASSIINASSAAVAPQIVLGGVSVHVRLPTLWNVNIYQSATLGSDFQGFILPDFDSLEDLIKQDVSARTGIPVEEITQSPTCLATGGRRLKSALAAGGSDVSMELIAEVLTQSAMDYIVYSPLFETVDVNWAGPHQFGDTITVTARYSGGASETMTFDLAPDPKIIVDGGRACILHIVIFRRSDKWHLVATRTL